MDTTPTNRRKAFSVSDELPLINGLVSFWDLITNAEDNRASNDLSQRGAPVIGGPVDGQYCVTTDTSNHLYRASPTGLALNTFTIACWARATATTFLMQVAGVMHSTAATGVRYLIHRNSGSYHLRVSNGTTNVDCTATASGTLNTWIHIIATHNAADGDMRIYVNNGAISGNANSGYATLNNTPTGVGIGGEGDGGGTNAEFEGSIKCVGIWNRLLSPANRTALYNGGTVLHYADI